MPGIPANRTAGAFLQQLGVHLGDGEKPLRTPVVKDVFELARRHVVASTIVWTNFDLILREDFYVVVSDKLRSQAGFSVLRLDLLIERDKHPDLAEWPLTKV